MIFNTIIYLAYSLLIYLFRLLPSMGAGDYAMIDTIINSYNGLRGFLETANWFFPVDVFFYTIKLIIIFRIVLAGFLAIKYFVVNLSGGIVK